jgi:transposase-like protein
VVWALKAADVDDRIRLAATTIYQALIDAELNAAIGAGPHERTETRTAQRTPPHPDHHGRGSGAADSQAARRVVLPSLLERRRRIDQALFAVLMEAYLHGSPPARSTTWCGRSACPACGAPGDERPTAASTPVASRATSS